MTSSYADYAKFILSKILVDETGKPIEQDHWHELENFEFFNVTQRSKMIKTSSFIVFYEVDLVGNDIYLYKFV